MRPAALIVLVTLVAPIAARAESPQVELFAPVVATGPAAPEPPAQAARPDDGDELQAAALAPTRLGRTTTLERLGLGVAGVAGLALGLLAYGLSQLPH